MRRLAAVSLPKQIGFGNGPIIATDVSGNKHLKREQRIRNNRRAAAAAASTSC
jgi:hypothetical protein